MNKVPCGGFFVGNGLSVDKDGVLSASVGETIIINCSDVSELNYNEIVQYIKNGKLVAIYFDDAFYFYLSDYSETGLTFTHVMPLNNYLQIRRINLKDDSVVPEEEVAEINYTNGFD